MNFNYLTNPIEDVVRRNQEKKDRAEKAIKFVFDTYIGDEFGNFVMYTKGMKCSKKDLKKLFELHIVYSLLVMKHDGDLTEVYKRFEDEWNENHDDDDCNV